MRTLLLAGLLFVSALAGCVQSAADTDHDGLSDAKEGEIGTNPTVADSDNDGLSDGKEVDQTHTDPEVADSDGDKVSDGAELEGGTDPLNATDEGYKVPPVPKMDGVAIATDHAKFVTAHKNRANNAPDHEAARQDLLGQFRDAGLDTYRMNFSMNGLDQANILGIKWGLIRDHWVVVGGHYDTLSQDCLVLPEPCPGRRITAGAYDNGSGTMLTVALGKAYANVTTYYTVVFVGMDGEERGTEGAAAFVDQVTTGTSGFGAVTLAGELDIDMLGLNWPGVNAPIDILTNSLDTSALIHERAKVLGFPDGQLVDKDHLALGKSDYVHFWSLDDPPVPTVFLISDFEEQGTPSPAPEQAHTVAPLGVYPFWHLDDTIETMRSVAGDPPAAGVPHPNVEAGFQSAADLTAQVVHFMACEPGTHLDAKQRN
ncbi:MAG: M28 family peptidase [Halobacteriales archaeon]|nr:M28 family peptidase [Halobacteriales archaeon]